MGSDVIVRRAEHFNISTFQHFNISTFQHFNISRLNKLYPIRQSPHTLFENSSEKSSAGKNRAILHIINNLLHSQSNFLIRDKYYLDFSMIATGFMRLIKTDNILATEYNFQIFLLSFFFLFSFFHDINERSL
jgi:hypothetical protein